MYAAQDDTEKAAFEAAFSRLGLPLNEELAQQLARYLELLIRKNQELNLTRIASFEDAVVLHIEDSLAVLPEFAGRTGLFCDIGTGGGVPGIPLALAAGRQGVLLDSVQKKAAAVQGFIEELGLCEQLTSVGERSELYAGTHAGEFDTVVARAVASLVVVQELATPLLGDGGILIAMRGSEDAAAVERAKLASAKLGLELAEQREFFIGSPDTSYHRSVFVFQKVAEPAVKLPRRPGMAAKRPLA